MPSNIFRVISIVATVIVSTKSSSTTLNLYDYGENERPKYTKEQVDRDAFNSVTKLVVSRLNEGSRKAQEFKKLYEKAKREVQADKNLPIVELDRPIEPGLYELRKKFIAEISKLTKEGRAASLRPGAGEINLAAQISRIKKVKTLLENEVVDQRVKRLEALDEAQRLIDYGLDENAPGRRNIFAVAAAYLIDLAIGEITDVGQDFYGLATGKDWKSGRGLTTEEQLLAAYNVISTLAELTPQGRVVSIVTRIAKNGSRIVGSVTKLKRAETLAKRMRFKKDDLELFMRSVKKDPASRRWKHPSGNKGGRFADLDKKSGVKERHHIPCDSESPLPRSQGPAIEMDYDDHRVTFSCGPGNVAKEYRKRQRVLIEKGQFQKAMEMDIDEIKKKFPGKYDKAIKEMLEYATSLGL